MWLLLLSAAAVSTARKGLGEGLRLALTRQREADGETFFKLRVFFFSFHDKSVFVTGDG